MYFLLKYEDFLDWIYSIVVVWEANFLSGPLGNIQRTYHFQ